MNFTVPPPFSNAPINACNCPTVDPNVSCVRWTSTEWLITTGMLSTFIGIGVTALTVYVNKLKKTERKKMVTDLQTITENDSIPEIMVMQR
jgi:hypothetical protein